MNQTLPPPQDPGSPPPRQWPGQGYGLPPGYRPALLRPDEERLWSPLSHLSLFVLAIIAPVIIMVTLGKRSPYVRHHAVEALNFQITVAIAVIVIALMSFVIVFLTFLTDSGFSLVVAIVQPVLLLAVVVASIVLPILAAVRSYQGRLYRYPLVLRFMSDGLTGPMESPSNQEGMDKQQGPQQGAAAPQYSSDGRWWWNGREWQPVSLPAPPPSSSQRRSPARWLYVVAAVVFAIGALAAATLSVLLSTGPAQAYPFNATHIIAPGRTEITLTEPGHYTIGYEYQTVVAGRTFTTPPRFPSIDLQLIPAAGGAQVPIYPVSGSPTYEGDNTKGEDIAEFNIDRGGKYVLASQYRAGEEGQEVVLAVGRNADATIGLEVFGLGGGIAFMLTGAIIAIVVVILRARA